MAIHSSGQAIFSLAHIEGITLGAGKEVDEVAPPALRKTAMPVELFQLSFRVFACACPTVISSIFGKNFHFPFRYFVLFVLRYFPFQLV